MAEQKEKNGCFDEAVCIDASRIYDSCCDKDCLEDLRVYFTDCTQPIIDKAINVKVRSAEVINVFIDVESVAFNRGFYSIDMTFFFQIKADAYTSPLAPACPVKGLAVFTKKCILFGSDGSVKVFSSEFSGGEDDEQMMPCSTTPKATVQVVDPIVLSSRLCEEKSCCEPCGCIPKKVNKCFDGDFAAAGEPEKTLLVTLGLFTIVQLSRNVQMQIPVYDFCIPQKECDCSTDSPCDLFRKISFPTDEFFPPKEFDDDDRFGCGCDKGCGCDNDYDCK